MIVTNQHGGYVMTVNQLIRNLQNLRDDFKEMDVVIECPNGLEVSPKIKMGVEQGKHILVDKDCVDRIVLSWD
jgi:hypothetical protein